MAQTRVVGGVSWPYDSFATSTMQHIGNSGAVQESVIADNRTIEALTGGKFKKKAGGGDRIQENVRLGNDHGGQSYSGYEAVNIDPVDNVVPAFYDWASYSMPIVISGYEKRHNNSKEKVFDLVSDKSMEAADFYQELINQHLWDVTVTAASTGNSGKNIIPIPGLVSKTPTSGTVGLLDRSTYSAWRNKTKDGSGYGTLAKFKMGITYMIQQCSAGAGGAPDTIISNMIAWRNYHNSMQEQVRYKAGDKASIGFTSLDVGGASFFWDAYVPDAETPGNSTPDSPGTYDTVYFINSKFMKFYVCEGADFTTTEFVRPANQVASTALMLLDAQLVSNALRKHGVMYKISELTT